MSLILFIYVSLLFLRFDNNYFVITDYARFKFDVFNHEV